MGRVRPAAVARSAIALVLAYALCLPAPALAHVGGTLAAGAPKGNSGLSAVALAIQAVQVPPDYSWYDSTRDTFTLRDEGEGRQVANKLAGLRDIVNGTATIPRDNFYHKTVVLDASPNLAGLEWTPIGTREHPFQGTFDGGGNQVSGFTVDAAFSYAGLFGATGAASALKDVRVAGEVRLGTDAAPYVAGRMECIGGLVGSAGGTVSGCASSVTISIVNDSPVSDAVPVIVDGVGGVVGRCAGALEGCSFKGSIDLRSASSTSMAGDQGYLIMTCVGGVAGFFGDLDAPGSTTVELGGCVNEGSVRVNTAGYAEGDRFGERVVAQCGYVGGVVGYSTGSVRRCRNLGAVDTSYRMSSEIYGTDLGAAGSYIGGVVGALRGDVFWGMTAPVAGAYDAGTASAGNPVECAQCVNVGSVFGNHGVGGVVGETGWYASVVECVCAIPEGNASPSDPDYLIKAGGVKAARWNKPMAGGIVGKSYGDIAYCYNRSRVWSTTNAGYYVAGIAGVMFRGTSLEGYVAPVPETWACYNTGYAQSGLRAASLVGQNEGYLHDCYALPGTSYHAGDAEDLVYSQYATVARCGFLEPDVLSGAAGVGKLNFTAGEDGWKRYFVAVPDGVENAGFPLLQWQYAGDVTDLSQATVNLSLERDADYTGGAAVPRLQAYLQTASGQVQLVQDADFQVIVSAASVESTLSADRTTGTRPYAATIRGMGRYEGTPAAQASYGIVQGDLSTCTFAGIERVFTGSPIVLAPDDVVIYTPSGTVVPSERYTVEVNGGRPCTTRGSYKVAATAKGGAGSNFVGTLEDADALTVAPADLYGDCQIERVSSGAESFGSDELDSLAFTYTGSPIYPTVDRIVYAPAGGAAYTLVQGRSATDYGTDYYVTYQSEGSYTDVTPAGERLNIDIASVAPTTLGRFHNYVDLFFRIVPAQISSTQITVPDQAYTGSPRGTCTVRFGGETLVEGRDYVVSYSDNVNAGTARATITGKGNFAGTVQRTFAITAAPAQDVSTFSVAPIARQGWTGAEVRPAVHVTGAGGSTLVEGSDYRVTYEDNVNAGTARAIVTGVGSYGGQVSVTFEIVKRTVTVKAGFGRFGLSYASYALDGGALLANTGQARIYERGIGQAVQLTAVRPTSVSTGCNLSGITVRTASGEPVSCQVVSVENDTSTSGANRITCLFSVPDADVVVESLDYVEATRELAGCTVAPIPDQPYTASAVEPAVRVWDGARELVAGVDFAVLRYVGNVNVGTAGVTVVGRGDYRGYQDAEFAITSTRTLAVSAADASFVYDGRPHGGIEAVAADAAATVRYGLAPDACTLESCPTFTDAGIHTVYFTARVPSAIGSGSARVVIARRPVTVRADDAIKARGAADPLYSASEEGLVVGDEGLLEYGVARASAGLAAQAEEATGRFSGALVASGASEQGNYLVSYEAGALEVVEPGTMFAYAPNVDVRYDGQPHSIEVACGVAGATVRYGLAEGAYDLDAPPAFSDVGSRVVYFCASAPGQPDVSGSATVRITRRAASVRALPASKLYGESNPGSGRLAAQAEGFLAGDEPAWSVTLAGVDAESPAGTYEGAVRVSLVQDQANYRVALAPADFTVEPRPLGGATVSRLRSHAFDGEPYEPYPDVELDGVRLTYGRDFSVSYVDAAGRAVAHPTEVGAYTCLVTGKGNYGGEASAAFAITSGASVSMLRLYNPNSGEHFYTADEAERANLEAAGWAFEGVGWEAPEASGAPVFRLYNPNAGDHHYTLDADERAMLLSVGWNDEGTGWYSDEAEGVPLYRQYNPNALSGSHNYTTSKAENDYLVSLGWREEGIGWYGTA